MHSCQDQQGVGQPHSSTCHLPVGQPHIVTSHGPTYRQAVSISLMRLLDNEPVAFLPSPTDD